MKERKRGGSCFLAGLLVYRVPETVVLIAMCSMNIHQYDHYHFLDPHGPSDLEIDLTYPHLSSHRGSISDSRG